MKRQYKRQPMATLRPDLAAEKRKKRGVMTGAIIMGIGAAMMLCSCVGMALLAGVG